MIRKTFALLWDVCAHFSSGALVQQVSPLDTRGQRLSRHHLPAGCCATGTSPSRAAADARVPSLAGDGGGRTHAAARPAAAVRGGPSGDVEALQTAWRGSCVCSVFGAEGRSGEACSGRMPDKGF